MNTKSKCTITGLGMIVAGATLTIGFYSITNLVLGSLSVAIGMCILMFLGTWEIGGMASEFVHKHSDSKSTYDVELGLTWDKDGRKGSQT